ncbi:MAG TPA: rRNA maturation RNase YbeY [Candidatus Omnitrophica bacterium]|nr:rRNA maturation RNase YbeY [Candidatus Omnitrophota bacterium]
MDLVIRNLQNKIPLNLLQIKKIARAILRRESVRKNASLSVVFVTNQKIRALNKKFLNVNYATDVLAFDLRDLGAGQRPRNLKGEKEINGEVIVSTDAVIQNAKQYKTTLGRELALYLAHGILHLLGFDDHGKEDILRMRRKEEEMLEFLVGKMDRVIERHARRIKGKG